MNDVLFNNRFALSWRSMGSRDLQPVIRRELEFPAGAIFRRFYSNGPQDPPIGVYERLFAASGDAPQTASGKSRASAWTWIAGRDDYLPTAPGIKRETEWVGYDSDDARFLFPNCAPLGIVQVDARRVLLKEQVPAFPTKGVRAFALSCGEAVHVAALASGEAVFFADDPELVLCDGREELVLIAEMLSKP